MELDTVKVQHADDYMIINKSDFDPAIHKLYEGPKAGKDAGGGKEKGPKAGKDAGGGKE